MEELELIGSKRPRMVSVQSTGKKPLHLCSSQSLYLIVIFSSILYLKGCYPIVRAFEAGDHHSTLFEGAKTVADGLRVPIALGDFLILKVSCNPFIH